jgi:hypothetical protein
MFNQRHTFVILVNPSLAILSTYRARPLDGIWATAPYLHNGSVPNLYQLLLPAEQRITTFKVGSDQFDPVKVGFVTDQGFEFNTALLGNPNWVPNHYANKVQLPKFRLVAELCR